jgi:hypothetical protein
MKPSFAPMENLWQARGTCQGSAAPRTKRAPLTEPAVLRSPFTEIGAKEGFEFSFYRRTLIACGTENGGRSEGSELKPSTVHREQLAFQDWAEFFLEIIPSRHFELWNIMPRAVMLYVRHPTFFQRACHEMPCPPLYR